jgi:hypothetical protein
MTKVMAAPELSAMYRDYTVQYTAFFIELFAKAVEQGDILPHDAKSRALAYESALDGVLWYLSVNKDISYEETVKGFEEVFVNSLLIPEKRSKKPEKEQ